MSIYEKSLSTRFRIINGKSYLIQNDNVYELDSVGQYVWELINGVNTIDDIITSVAHHFNVDSSNIRTEIFDFLNDLRTSSLIEE